MVKTTKKRCKPCYFVKKSQTKFLKIGPEIKNRMVVLLGGAWSILTLHSTSDQNERICQK